MTSQAIIFSILLLSACSNEASKKITLPDKSSREIRFEELEIPKQWIELSKINNSWTYFIPCQFLRGLQTIDIKKIDNQNAIYFYWGLEGQWFSIRKIVQQGDSLCFTGVLPYDTTQTGIFTMKYIDRARNIVQWTTGETIGIFIPIVDTIKFNRVVQKCDAMEK
jgi:hypothetical protein